MPGRSTIASSQANRIRLTSIRSIVCMTPSSPIGHWRICRDIQQARGENMADDASSGSECGHTGCAIVLDDAANEVLTGTQTRLRALLTTRLFARQIDVKPVFHLQELRHLVPLETFRQSAH